LANGIKLLALSPASGHTKQVMDVKGHCSERVGTWFLVK